MILEIQTGQDNPILRQQAIKVKKITAEIKQLVLDMEETLVKNNGLGLAAVQLGKNLSIIQIDISALYPDDKEANQITLINPKITRKSWEQTITEEGCLSLPGLYLDIKRPAKVTVEGLNIEGQSVKIKANGLLSKVLQHEIDHLSGILITDKTKEKA